MRKLTLFSLWFVVFSIPWEEAFSLPGVGTIARALGYATLYIALMNILSKVPFRKLDPLHFLAAAFLFWATLTMMWSEHPIESLNGLLSLARVMGSRGWFGNSRRESGSRFV